MDGGKIVIIFPNFVSNIFKCFFRYNVHSGQFFFVSFSLISISILIFIFGPHLHIVNDFMTMHALCLVVCTYRGKIIVTNEFRAKN